jgi:hypothetical protein
MALLVIAAPGPVSAQARPPVVTAATQVTVNPAPVRAHSSPQIGRNPRTGELVVAEADVRGSRACAVHISADQGRSWFPGGNPMMAPFTDCTIGAEWGTYVTVVFADDGTLYLPFAANDPKDFASTAATGGNGRKFVPRHLFLARSTDGGRTFTTTKVYDAPAGDPARGYAYGVMGAVHPDDPSKVYVTWARGDFLSRAAKTHAAVAASNDGGRTFSPAVDITDGRGSEQAWLAVDRQGVLHAVWWSLGWDSGKTLFQWEPEDPPLPMIYGRSTDEGRTWARTDIDPGYQEYPRHPVIAADPGSDRLYALWHGNAESANLPLKFDDADRADVWLRVSPDSGRTWSDRRRVNDEDRANHAHPGISIAPGGRVDVAWYDGRLSPKPPVNVGDETGLQDVFMASSTDGGRAFGENVRISDRSIDRSIGVWSNNVGSAAPVGIASAEDSVHLAWQDTRNGNTLTQAEDVYVASALLGSESTESSRDTPGWLLAAAGLAAGMAVAMLAVLVVRRT